MALLFSRQDISFKSCGFIETKWLMWPQGRSYLTFLKPKNERKTDGEGLVCVHYIHLCVLASREQHSSWRVSHVGLWLKAWWTGIRKCGLDCPGMELSLSILICPHPPSLSAHKVADACHHTELVPKLRLTNSPVRRESWQEVQRFHSWFTSGKWRYQVASCILSPRFWETFCDAALISSHV